MYIHREIRHAQTALVLEAAGKDRAGYRQPKEAFQVHTFRKPILASNALLWNAQGVQILC